jgi:hypothetical protein
LNAQSSESRISGCAGDDSTISSQPRWWPPKKLSGRYLAPYVSRQSREDADVMPSTTTASRLLNIRSKGAHHE